MKRSRHRDRLAKTQALFGEAASTGDYPGLVSTLATMARDGDGDALASLGTIYAEGVWDAAGREVIPRDRAKAARLFRKSAQMGSSFGMAGYADHLMSAKSVTNQRFEQAKLLYQRAARGQYAPAALNLAVAYLCRGRARDAATWFRTAAALGSEFAKLELAKAEFYGVGRARSPLRALRTIVTIAERSRFVSDHDRVQALLFAANALREGWLVKQDLPRSLALLKKAADLGSTTAASLLENQVLD